MVTLDDLINNMKVRRTCIKEVEQHRRKSLLNSFDLKIHNYASLSTDLVKLEGYRNKILK